MFLVTGATGKVGRQVVSQLLDAGHPVRAVVRDPANARLPDGADTVRADLSDPESLAPHVAGIDAVFLVWPFFSADGADAVLDLIKPHARRIVYLSSDGVEDSEAVDWAAGVERAVETSGLEWAFLRPTGFAGNTLGWVPRIRAEDVVREPFGALARPLIHERDIAAVAVRALVEDGHAGAKYVLSGPELVSTTEQVRIIGEAIGRPVRFEELTPDDARTQMLADGWPESFVDGALEAWAGMVQQPERITSTVQDVTGAPARTFREWAADHADDFRAPAGSQSR